MPVNPQSDASALEMGIALLSSGQHGRLRILRTRSEVLPLKRNLVGICFGEFQPEAYPRAFW
jgi:hypothetical protein